MDDPVTPDEYRERIRALAAELLALPNDDLSRRLRELRQSDPKLCSQVQRELLRQSDL